MLKLSKDIFKNFSKNYEGDYSVFNSLIYRIIKESKMLFNEEKPLVKLGDSSFYLLKFNIFYEKEDGKLDISFSLFDYDNYHYYSQRRNEPQNRGALCMARVKEESVIDVKVNYYSKTPGFFNVRRFVVSTKNDRFEELEDGYKHPILTVDRLDVIPFDWCDKNLGTNRFKLEKEFKSIC